MKHILLILSLLVPFCVTTQVNILQFSNDNSDKSLILDGNLPTIDHVEAARTEILSTNGKSKVKVLNRADWSRIYSLFETKSDLNSPFMSYQELFNNSREDIDNNRIYPIVIMDYDYKTNHDQSFSKESKIKKTFSSMILSRSIVGDEIKFIIPNKFLLTNTNYNYDIEVDFDNGDGFIPVELNTVQNVNFKGQRKEFLEMVLRVRRNTDDYIYSHFTLRRKSSKIVPTVKHIKDFTAMRSAPPANHEFLWNDSQTNLKITATILYSNNQNGESKLRRPILITDGFDPEDLRTYDNYNSSSDLDRVESRGLFQFVNGDPSDWESESSANFANKLLADGYDIVFINFETGAADIISNGIAFKNFLNNVVNGPIYRDSKTEMNIIVGPSMGGMVTRYALSKLEADNIPHFTKSWIAFDSPMNGAYIPISLQYAVDFMYTWSFGQSNAIEEAKDKLDSYAALQLLKEHYNSSAHIVHNNFYSIMNSQGYPDLLKRYAVTNGGKSRMFPHSPVGNYENVLFKYHWAPDPEMFGNSMHNTNSSTTYRLFRGVGSWGTTDKYVDYNIAYDGAVGGYNTALYAISGDDSNNLWDKDPNNSANFPYMKATFIPVASALGFEPSPSNVYDSWEDFSVSSSPFDQFFGMENNEEHANISQFTSDEVIEVFFRPDFNNGEVPFNRNGNSDIVFDKPVAFTHKNTVTFGGNGNTVEFEDGTDVNIKATDLIKFESGVFIKQGAKISANTEPVNYSTVFRSGSSRLGLDSLATSETRGKVYNYVKSQENGQLEFKLSPNPAVDFVRLNNAANEEITFGIYSISGDMVKKILISAETTQRIDISNLSPGNYFIKNFSDSSISKFIKIK